MSADQLAPLDALADEWESEIDWSDGPRRSPMTDPTPDPIRDVLAEVREDHEWDEFLGRCACGWETPEDDADDETEDGHERHVDGLQAAAVRAHLTSEETVERAARAMSSTVPNSGGVLWVHTHDDGQEQPVTLTDAARAALGEVSS